MASRHSFASGDANPNALDLGEREKRILALELGTLQILVGSLRRAARSRLLIDAVCTVCGRSRTLHVDNIMARKTRNCTCQRGKYHDPRAHTLGQRYDAMVQRCERDTHVSSKHYRGRGVSVEFKSREEFVRWALGTFPSSDFKGLDFDRIDNDGNYSEKNLRLVSRSENLLNRRRRPDG